MTHWTTVAPKSSRVLYTLVRWSELAISAYRARLARRWQRVADRNNAPKTIRDPHVIDYVATEPNETGNVASDELRPLQGQNSALSADEANAEAAPAPETPENAPTDGQNQEKTTPKGPRKPPAGLPTPKRAYRRSKGR